MFSPCLLNGTLRQSIQLGDKIGHELDMHNLIRGARLSEEYPFHHAGRGSQQTQVFGGLWVDRILEDATKDGEERRHGVKDEGPGKSCVSRWHTKLKR